VGFLFDADAGLFSTARGTPFAGSTSREKDSHHLLPISCRASAVFRSKAAASGFAEFDPSSAREITIPSTSRERAN